MSTIQEIVHNTAMKKTKAKLKERGIIVTQKSIEKLLKLIHLYFIHITRTMYRRVKWEEGSVDKFFGIGYFRTIFPRLFTDMYNEGLFTEEEFKVITEELYKEEFKVYNNIIKNGKIWLKQQKLKKKS
jgi:hypothetical protein